MKWESIDGWYDFEVMYQEIVDKYAGGLLIEVGTYLGRSLCSLGQMVKESGKPYHVIGIDTCLGTGEENGIDNHGNAVIEGGGTFAATLHKNIIDCGLQSIVSLLITDSVTASRCFSNNTLTMVCLDAAHDFPNVKRDIEAWLPKIKRGGILCGDDMGIEGEVPVWPGVRQAVQEMLPGYQYKPHDAWWWEKL